MRQNKKNIFIPCFFKKDKVFLEGDTIVLKRPLNYATDTVFQLTSSRCYVIEKN